MLRMRLLGLILVAISACSTAASASAHSFNSTVAGKLTRVSNQTQVLKLGTGVALECSTNAINGGNTAIGKQLILLLRVKYSGCIISGLFEATFDGEFHLEMSADGFWNLKNTIVILVPIASCHITIKSQNLLRTVKYSNVGKNLVEEPTISGIASEGSGGECGGASSTGTFKGNTTVEVPGGTISWE